MKYTIPDVILLNYCNFFEAKFIFLPDNQISRIGHRTESRNRVVRTKLRRLIIQSYQMVKAATMISIGPIWARNHEVFSYWEPAVKKHETIK